MLEALRTGSLLRTTILLPAALLAAATLLGTGEAHAAERVSAQGILQSTGVQGGLIVHLGCRDGKLTAALRASDSYLVLGLDKDAHNVRQAREHIRSLGLYGSVSADQFEGRRLPLIDNLANLVVAEDLGDVPMDEVMRVLCPGGVAYLRRDGRWIKTVKPRPSEIDEWTHCLHDATNNPVAHDVVGPPRRLQWVGSPRWSRHHDNMSSVSAVVSSGGRLFYIFDEGSRSSIFLPSKWSLIARDAFNGCVLWKRPIPKWHVRLWPLKSGPAQLARRLVAVGDTVFVALGIDAPLTALNAATGETIRTYEGTQATEEILYCDGVLFAVVRPQGVDSAMHRDQYDTLEAVRSHRREWRWQEEAPRTIVALSAQTGNVLWRARSPVAQGTLAVDDRSAYFYDGEKIVCLDRASGRPRWQSQRVASRPLNHTGYTPNLLVYEDVVLFAGGNRTMTALSATTGDTLWSAEHHRGGHNSPEDLLVVGGLVWSAAIAGSSDSGVWTGRDPRTGEIKNEFLPDVNTYWFHHRCYRAKATDRYLLPSRTGIEFVDFNKQTWEIHHWVRGACLYGIMPCNGLIYAPQHPCACYPEAKLDGFNALAPASKGPRIPENALAQSRIQRGPAYGQVHPSSEREADWPTYRHDGARSGRTEATVPTRLQEAWKTDLGGRLTSVVVADGRLFVASVDTHTVHALDAQTGRKLWSYTAGGRVDSPPTIYQGTALFGSADGYVYCLRASDGELVWRFRAAPIDQRLVAFEQLESVWPVHGSVLVEDDVLYFAAGRNMFLDGGVWLYRLEPKTGKILSATHMDDRHPETGENLQANVQILNMPVAIPDILSSDGVRVYMKSQVFDMAGNRQALGPHSGEPAVQGWVQRGDEAHLFCPSGFVDDAFWHRTYWVYGRSFAGGHAGYSQAGKFAPSGRILVVDEHNVYGYGRKPQYYRWTTPIEYQLWAADKEAPEVPKPRPQRRGGTTSRPTATAARVCVEKSASLNPAAKPLAVEAWVKAEKPNGVILARGGSRLGYALFLNEGKPCFAVRNDSDLGTASAEQKLPQAWVHLAGVLTADKKLQLFVDGKLAATGKAPGLIAEDPSNAMEIGEDASSAVGDYRTPFSFTGMIDEVRVYHGSVEADEIARHAATPGRKALKDARLVLCMSFDDGQAKDESGHGNHGRIEGAEPAEGKVGGGLLFTPLPHKASTPSSKKPQGAKQAAAPAAKKQTSSRAAGFHVTHHWTQELPLVVRAMVQAGDTLFIAGPPDLLDEEDAAKRLGTPEIQAQLAEQDRALMDKRAGLLWAVSTKDGAKLGELRLTAPPAWDGMAAAQGRLYMAAADGTVRCFVGR